MSKYQTLIKLATGAALAGGPLRNYQVGAAALRKDGTFVAACNGCIHSDRVPSKVPYVHAEARLARKLDVGAIVCVVRLSKAGEYKLAFPCPRCFALLKRRGVKRIYFSTEGGMAFLLLSKNLFYTPYNAK